MPTFLEQNVDSESGTEVDSESGTEVDSESGTEVDSESGTEVDSEQTTDSTVDSEQERRVIPPGAVFSYVDGSNGAGSMTPTEDWVRANSREPSNDGRSPTNTYFDSRDTDSDVPPWQQHRDPEDQRDWETLAHWQDGAHSDISRGGQNWRADKRRWVQTFGRTMNANEYHIERALYIAERIEINTYTCRNSSNLTITTELVLLCVLSLLIDADIESFDQRAYVRDGTQQLLSDIEAGVNEYERVRSLLRQEDGELLFRY